MQHIVEIDSVYQEFMSPLLNIEIVIFRYASTKCTFFLLTLRVKFSNENVVTSALLGWLNKTCVIFLINRSTYLNQDSTYE